MKRVYPATIQSGASQTGNYLLMLLEPEGNIEVPVIIGQHEAQGILLAKENVKIRRPLTHEVVLHIMEAFGLTLKEVTIDRVVEGVFYATLHLTDGFNEKHIDCRTSDAITLALHSDTPIMMEENVLEETGIKGGEMSEHQTDNTSDASRLAALEEELHRCEENEDYERAAEIQQEIEKMKNEQ